MTTANYSTGTDPYGPGNDAPGAGLSVSQQIQENQIAGEITGTSADADFIQGVIGVLLSTGLDLTRIDPGTLTTLVTQLWQNSYVQTAYSQAGNIASSTVLDDMRAQLFSPSAYGDPNIYVTGIGLLASQGKQLTSSQQTALGAQTTTVPTPWDGNYQVSLAFGTPEPPQFGGSELGVDYAMPVGTSLYSPFAGTVVSTEDNGKNDWGKRVIVRLASGQEFAIGHMTNFSVSVGEQINPGDLLGLSGGDPSDPSSGESTGAHVEFQWGTGLENPQTGNFQDPTPILDQVFGGTTFAGLNMSAEAGSGVSTSDSQARLLGTDATLNAEYPNISNLWTKYFGNTPKAAQVLAIVNGAGNDPNAQEQMIRSMPSPSITGATTGQAFDIFSNMNSAMQPVFGHNGTLGMVQELFNSGEVEPWAIKNQLEQWDALGQIPASAALNLTNSQSQTAATTLPTAASQSTGQSGSGAAPTAASIIANANFSAPSGGGGPPEGPGSGAQPDQPTRRSGVQTAG